MADMREARKRLSVKICVPLCREGGVRGGPPSEEER